MVVEQVPVEIIIFIGLNILEFFPPVMHNKSVVENQKRVSGNVELADLLNSVETMSFESLVVHRDTKLQFVMELERILWKFYWNILKKLFTTRSLFNQNPSP